jgi:hypothetical protein
MCLRLVFIPAEWQVPTPHSSFLFQRLWDAYELIQTIRKNILSDLRLFASRDEQRSYPVPVEYFCVWGGDHYHSSDIAFQKAFTNAERAQLAEFDKHLETAFKRIGKLPSTPEELWTHSEWEVVMQKASDLMKEWKQ